MMIRASLGNRGIVANGELLTSTAKASKPIAVKRWNGKVIEWNYWKHRDGVLVSKISFVHGQKG